MDYSFKNTIRPKPGSILLSDPFLQEDYFTRSVVLVCEHNSNGSFGLVLNNLIDIQLNQLDPAFPITSKQVSIGGPVDEQNICYVHSFGERVENSLFISDDIYFGGDFDQLSEAFKNNPGGNLLFFLGYSGWSPGQLSEELKANSWLVIDNITPTEIYEQPSDFWKYCMNKQGKRFAAMSNFPINPHDN